MRGKLDHRAKPTRPLPTAAPGRPAERRDLRVRKRLRLKAALSVIIGVLLGIAAAWLVLRFSSMVQPPPSE
jgi:hypothetical protein